MSKLFSDRNRNGMNWDEIDHDTKKFIIIHGIQVKQLVCVTNNRFKRRRFNRSFGCFLLGWRLYIFGSNCCCLKTLRTVEYRGNSRAWRKRMRKGGIVRIQNPCIGGVCFGLGRSIHNGTWTENGLH